jgi:hypothetical protein
MVTQVASLLATCGWARADPRHSTQGFPGGWMVLPTVASSQAETVTAPVQSRCDLCWMQRLLRRGLHLAARCVNHPFLSERRVGHAVQPRTGQFSEALRHPAFLLYENAQLLSEKRINVTWYILCRCVLRVRRHSDRRRRERFVGSGRFSNAWLTTGWTPGGVARAARRTGVLMLATAKQGEASGGNQKGGQIFHKIRSG